MLHNKKGAALLQVLLVTVVLAGMATMLLRANLSRTTTSRQTRRAVSGQMLINACQAEVNALWSLKDPEVFAIDLQDCLMYCNRNIKQKCVSQNKKSYKCKPVTAEGVMYQVEATFTGEHPNETTGQCDIRYDIHTVTADTVDYPTSAPTSDPGNGGGNGNNNNNNNHFDPYEDYIESIQQAKIEQFNIDHAALQGVE